MEGPSKATISTPCNLPRRARSWVPMIRLACGAFLALLLSAAGPLNDTCPVSGDKADGKITADVKIGFCCANCKGRFDRDPVATLRKLDRIPVDTCPLSGKPIGDAVSTVTVALC